MLRNQWPLPLLLLLLPGVARTQDVPRSYQPALDDLGRARSYAMGSAYRALGVGTEAINGNPAAISVFKHYLIEAGGAWDTHTKYAFGSASVLDSTGGLGAGVTYHLLTMGRGPDRTTGHASTLGLAFPLFNNLFVGGSARYVVTDGRFKHNGITADAGVVLKISESIHLGASGHNLIDVRNPLLARYFALSGAYIASSFLVAADLRADFNSGSSLKLGYTVGAEYFAGKLVPLRVGYSYDNITHTQYLSGGIGIYADGAGVDFAYRHEVKGEEGRMIALTFKVQVG